MQSSSNFYGGMADMGHNVIVYLETPEGVPFVRDLKDVGDDPEKIHFLLFKLPGGKGEEGEDIFATGSRELREETGISVSPENLSILTRKPAGRNGHEFVLLYGRTDEVISGCSTTGEVAEVFPRQELPERLFPLHRDLMREVGLV